MLVSQLYSGGISDKEITLLERLDNVMADRGFVMNYNLEPLGCTLNIPPSLNNQRQPGQFSEIQVKEPQEIPDSRIHVERAISRIRTFKSYKMYFQLIRLVCLIRSGQSALLVNFQSPIIAQ